MYQWRYIVCVYMAMQPPCCFGIGFLLQSDGNLISISPLPGLAFSPHTTPPSPSPISHYLWCNKKIYIYLYKAMYGRQKLCISIATIFADSFVLATILLRNFIMNGCRLSAHWIQLEPRQPMQFCMLS